jgi:hypothetical protein
MGVDIELDALFDRAKRIRDFHFRIGNVDGYGDGLDCLGIGNTRAGYSLYDRHGSRWVLKLPLNFDGEDDNEHEYENYLRFDPDCPIGRCKLLLLSGVKVLLMEYLEWHILDMTEMEDWMWEIDSGQYGVSSIDGKIRIWDYGIDRYLPMPDFREYSNVQLYGLLSVF